MAEQKICRLCGKPYTPLSKFDATSVHCPECRKDRKTVNHEKYLRKLDSPVSNKRRELYNKIHNSSECKIHHHYEYAGLYDDLSFRKKTLAWFKRWEKLHKRYVYLRDTYVYGLHPGDGFMVSEKQWYKELNKWNIPNIDAFEHWLDVIEKGEE